MLKSLFNWVSGWWKKDYDHWNLFHPSERLIYSYFDGQKTNKCDPMVLNRSLMEWGPEIDRALQMIKTPGMNIPAKWIDECRVDLLEKLRKVFKILPFDQGGLTEIETVDLLHHFLSFCGGVKKNSSPSPISVKETLAPTEPSSVDPSPSTNTLDSGSTVNEPPSAVPILSDSELASPSELSTPETDTTKLKEIPTEKPLDSVAS